MTTSPPGIRWAIQSDFAPLLESATMIFLEGALQPVSKAKLGPMVQRCIDRDAAIAGVIEGPAGMEASVGMAIEEFDYSEEPHLAVKWLGVHPAFRRQNHGAKLLQFAQWAQGAMGVPLFLNLSTIEALEAKMHLYLRSVPQVGAIFSWGGVPEGAFSQSRVGDDRFQARRRLKGAADGRATPASRPAA